MGTSYQSRQPTGRDVPIAAMMPKNALVIDDHPLFCEALTMTLTSALQVKNVANAGSLAEATSWLASNQTPDLILLDLNLPDVDGLDGLLRLQSSAPDVPIIIISSMADERIISRAIKVGARGFVPKHAAREAFVAAFERISSGGKFLPEGFMGVPEAETRSLGAQDKDDVIERLKLLTRQQANILHLLCEGKLNKQIAYELDIAEATVKAHITAILRKLKVVSRTQAVVVAQSAQYTSILQNDSKPS